MHHLQNYAARAAQLAEQVQSLFSDMILYPHNAADKVLNNEIVKILSNLSSTKDLLSSAAQSIKDEVLAHSTILPSKTPQYQPNALSRSSSITITNLPKCS